MARTSKPNAPTTIRLPDPKELIEEAKEQKRQARQQAKQQRQSKPKEDRPKRKYGQRRQLSHGMYAGQLPDGCQYLKQRLDQFRRNLEDAVLAARKEVSVTDASSINTAVRCERTASLALRWLRLDADKMKPMEKLQFLERIHKASMDRDKAIKALGLSVQEETIDLRTYVEGKLA